MKGRRHAQSWIVSLSMKVDMPSARPPSCANISPLPTTICKSSLIFIRRISCACPRPTSRRNASPAPPKTAGRHHDDPSLFLPASPYVRKVMIAAYERGVIDQVEKLSSAADPVKRDQVIVKHNSSGKVPCARSITTPRCSTAASSRPMSIRSA